jgi:hypothetical protein
MLYFDKADEILYEDNKNKQRPLGQSKKERIGNEKRLSDDGL